MTLNEEHNLDEMRPQIMTMTMVNETIKSLSAVSTSCFIHDYLETH